MSQAASLFTRLEYRLADRLYHTRWLTPHSPRAQRLTLKLLRHCAEAGHPDALSTYGHMLFHGGTSPQDKARGARYMAEAAHAGDVKSQYQIAQIYEKGCAQYPRRDEYAVTWYARAAESGHYLAAERLAQAYQTGDLSLIADQEQSRYWQSLADQGLADKEASAENVIGKVAD